MYLLFAGDTYYPCGGWNDYRGSFATEEEAINWMVGKREFDWWHIVSGGEIIRRG
jgi:hypothetical protein